MAKSKIDRKAIIEKELKNRHIFSDKHLQNVILTKINGYTVQIRTNIVDGQVRSMDMMMGWNMGQNPNPNWNIVEYLE